MSTHEQEPTSEAAVLAERIDCFFLDATPDATFTELLGKARTLLRNAAALLRSLSTRADGTGVEHPIAARAPSAPLSEPTQDEREALAAELFVRFPGIYDDYTWGDEIGESIHEPYYKAADAIFARLRRDGARDEQHIIVIRNGPTVHSGRRWSCSCGQRGEGDLTDSLDDVTREAKAHASPPTDTPEGERAATKEDERG